MLDEEFWAQARGLLQPAMGTEEVGPLLYHLIRMLRPQRLVEVGMGYTTLFMARAVADNRAAFHAGGRALADKSRPLLDAGAEFDDAWVRAEPALLDPGHHAGRFAPRLLAIDDLADARSSAPRVRAALARLGLDGEVEVLPETLRTARDRIPVDFLPFDFAWLDVWEKIYLFERYWDLVDPDGGVVILHYMEGYDEGEEWLRRTRQRQGRDSFEVLTLREPHKVRQHGLTMIRRIGPAPHPPGTPASWRDAAARLGAGRE